MSEDSPGAGSTNDERTDRTDDADPGVDRRSVLRAVGAGAALTGVTSGRDARSTLAGLLTGSTPTGHSMADARIRATSRPELALAATDASQIQAKSECFRPNQREMYGPTDINAQSGNGGLSVAVNDAGTMTVLRWPYPSFYDQLKYFTTGRDADDEIDVLPNEGAFLGIALDTGDGFETTWLRDLDVTSQYHANDSDDTEATFSDEIVTVYTGEDGLEVTVRDLVAPDVDAFVRKVGVKVPPGRVEGAKLVAYENVNPVVSKLPQFPIQDWCTEELNQDVATYEDSIDAIVHRKAGVDVSTGEQQSVAIAMGFAGDSTGHQVGGDAYEVAAAPVADAGPLRDAYDDASDLPLSGNDSYVGQTTGALVTDLEFTGANATETVVFAAGHAPTEAAEVLGDVRNRDFETDVRAPKEEWLAGLLEGAPMPDTDDEDILALCRRALVTLVTDTEDTDNRAVVASIATQAPYGEDWPRDGAYFNYVLELVGLEDWVTDHNRWYADIQQQVTDPKPDQPTTPPGNWVMNYYGDGVAGGPIPYEIDETGYGVWTLWTHYEHTGDAAYLADVYPAIERAAEFLVRCEDPEGTGLHCPTWEDDRFQPQRPTIVGAALVWLGLKSAAAAARADDSPGTAADADRYETRQHEVGRAIDQHLYGDITGNGDVGYGTRIGFSMAEVTWPVCFTPYAEATESAADPNADVTIHDEPQVSNPYEHPRIEQHLTTTWGGVEDDFKAPEPAGNDTGQYEVKTLLPLAKAGRTTGVGTLSDVEDGLDWIATEHATDDTHIMGEAWKVFDGSDGEREVRSIVSQPHAWEQVLTYMAALEAYPPEDLAESEFDRQTCGSVLAALRDRQA